MNWKFYAAIVAGFFELWLTPTDMPIIERIGYAVSCGVFFWIGCHFLVKMLKEIKR